MDSLLFAARIAAAGYALRANARQHEKPTTVRFSLVHRKEADRLWAQLKVIARTLTRAGHMRPRPPRRPPPSAPGQRDFFGNFEEIHQSDAQRECTNLG